MKNLIILDDRRDVRNSLIALANAKGQPKSNIFTAESIGKFRDLAKDKGNEFIRNSNLILDVNLPDGKSSQLVKEFNLIGNFAIFSAMSKDNFDEFKSILEGSALYKGKVFPKDDPYGVLMSFGMLTGGKKALEDMQSISTDIGVAVHSPPYFIIERGAPNLADIIQHVQNIGINNPVVNVVLNYESAGILIDTLNTVFGITNLNAKFIPQADFLEADINIALGFPKDITGFPKAYERVASVARHDEGHESYSIKDTAQSYL